MFPRFANGVRLKVGQVSPVIVLSAMLVSRGVKAHDAASPSGLVRRGEEVAQLQCSACHVVAEKQKYPPLLDDPAPSFQSIAKRTQISEAALRHFVATTRWDRQTEANTMPNPGLTEGDIAAVSRYILSLKGHGGPPHRTIAIPAGNDGGTRRMGIEVVAECIKHPMKRRISENRSELRPISAEAL